MEEDIFMHLDKLGNELQVGDYIKEYYPFCGSNNTEGIITRFDRTGSGKDIARYSETSGDYAYLDHSEKQSEEDRIQYIMER
jgi:hypothetical protein